MKPTDRSRRTTIGTKLSHHRFRTESELLASTVGRVLEKAEARRREREENDRVEAERLQREEKEEKHQERLKTEELAAARRITVDVSTRSGALPKMLMGTDHCLYQFETCFLARAQRNLG